jgi:hypothetical protein
VKEDIMIRKTFKYNIEMPVTNTDSRDYLGSRTVKTEWTVDMQGDKVIDVDIIECDGDLDDRQFDTLKEICMAMRNMPAVTVELIDESVINISPENWKRYIAEAGEI